MSLIQFFRILYARRIILLTALISCLAVGVIMSQVLPKRYSAHARIMLDIVKPDPVTGQVLSSQFAKVYTRTQIELIKDYQIAEQVVDALGWSSNPDILQGFYARGVTDANEIRRSLARQIIGGTDARLIDASNILQITFSSSNPAAAKRIVTEIRDAYIEANLASEREGAGKTADWYASQVQDAQALVRAAEAGRAEYAKANGIVLQGDNSDLETSRLRALSSQSAVEIVAPAGTATSGVVSSSAQTQLETLNMQVEQAAASLGPKHPAFQALAKQREALERIVARERAAMAQPGRAAGESAREQISQAYERQKDKVVAQSEHIEMIGRMTRDIELKREQLAKVSDRASEFRLKANVGDAGLVSMGAATAPESAEFPNVPLIIAGSFGFGAALGVCLALLIELLGRRIRSQEDLEYAAGSPVFAEVGAHRRKQDTLYRKFVRYLTDRAQQARRARAAAVSAE